MKMTVRSFSEISKILNVKSLSSISGPEAGAIIYKPQDESSLVNSVGLTNSTNNAKSEQVDAVTQKNLFVQNT